MKKIMLGIVAAMFTVTNAVAADLPRPSPVYKAPPQEIVVAPFAGWTLGIQGGPGWAKDRTTLTGAEPIGSALIAVGVIPSTLDTDQRGWMIGANLGYDWQVGNFVFGVNTSLNYADINGDATSTFSLAPLGAPISLTTTGSQELEWYGRLVGRAGIVWDRALLYIDGGLAYGSMKNTVTATLSAPAPFGVSATATKDSTETGWTVGAGMKFALADGWKLRAGWEYMDFGDSTLNLAATVAGTVVAINAHQDNKYHVVLFGLDKSF